MCNIMPQKLNTNKTEKAIQKPSQKCTENVVITHKVPTTKIHHFKQDNVNFNTVEQHTFKASVSEWLASNDIITNERTILISSVVSVIVTTHERVALSVHGW